MSKNAFPYYFKSEGFSPESRQYGLTQREFYAAFAMLGHFIINHRNPGYIKAEDFAKGSLAMADALIEALEDNPK